MNDSIQEQENKIISITSDEIVFKEIILKIQKWWGILKPRILRIVLLSFFLGLGSALYTKFLTKPTYRASYQLFFQESNGGMSNAMRLASSFGLNSFSGGSASSSNAVQQYLTSRTNIAHAMSLDLKNGRLIDRYYAEAIAANEEFAQEFSSKFGANNRYTDSILTEVALKLTKDDKVLSAAMDEESGRLRFDVVHEDESFSYDLATSLVTNSENQFKDWKKQKGLDALMAFQKKVDSLELAIDASLRRLGEYEDRNNSLVSSVEKMKRMRLTIDLEALKVSYGEYIKGLEMSKAELMNLESPFKYFDHPTYPLIKEKRSSAKAGIFISSITCFFLVLFFIGKEEVKYIMAD